MPIGEGFHVEPKDLSKAGNNATEIGDRILRDGGDLPAQAGNVSGGLDGFQLAGALSGCTQAWDDKLTSVAHQTHGAGKQLLGTASTYEETDAAGRGGFDTIVGSLRQPPG